MPWLTELSITGFSRGREKSCIPTGGKFRNRDDAPGRCGKGRGSLLLFSEDPNLPSGSFFQVLQAELAGFITGRSGGTGLGGDLLLPAALFQDFFQ